MLTSIGDVMRECHNRGWITTRDGNISVRRRGYNTIVITPSGVRKNLIHPEFLVRMKVQEGRLQIPDGVRPSGELQMHWQLQRPHSETRTVLHCHPTHIIAAMFAGFDLQELADQFPEVSRYTRVGVSIPNVPVLSNELALCTRNSMIDTETGEIKFDIVGQENHGVCSIGKSPWDAFEHVERLNHICEIVLASGVSPSDRRIS